MKVRAILAVLIVISASASGTVAAQGSADSYSSDLSRVYWGYYQVLTQKDVCDSAAPATRSANGTALAAWQTKHKALVDELRRRVTAMIRLASTDEKDYTRNLGKYEGAILQERQDYRESLLKLDAKELRAQCQRMSGVLKGPEADLEKVYAVELDAIRKRK